MAKTYLDDLRHDLQDEEYRFQYLSACAMDSGEALRVGIRDVLATHDQKVRREVLEEAAKDLDQWLNEKWLGSPADVIRSLASGAVEKEK